MFFFIPHVLIDVPPVSVPTLMPRVGSWDEFLRSSLVSEELEELKNAALSSATEDYLD